MSGENFWRRSGPTQSCRAIEEDDDLGDNMLTKYQMIRFIDFCEVSFLPESIARVVAIVGDHRCHTPRHCFKETWDEFLGYSRPSSFHRLPKLIWCSNWGCNLG
ncbi:uncharacterized protein TNCV_2601111 [Trichonephila clavipes]|nr:uncharacterized protein TNCV_2601111 [Trichonephila clavipes]